MRKAIFLKNNRGFGVVEILAAVAIVAIAFVLIMEIYAFLLQAGGQNEKRLQAAAFAQEAIEAVRSARDESWDNIGNLTFGAPYYPSVSGTPAKWILSSGQETVNGFTRQIIASRVERDSNDNIVESGGTEDSGTRKIVATVSWQDRGKNYSVELATYLTDWR